jgi:diadenosine tetraphosphate (Ap4A) HIT family hydrolase
MYQYRKTHKKYLQHKRHDAIHVSCTFCETITKEQLVNETKYTMVIPNRTFYDTWELHDVLDHLLVVPKHHVHSLNDLQDEELLDAMKICAEYEAKGYNVYARGSGSVRRSVSHQHTHLIKIDSKPPRISFFLHKPYLLIKF